MEKKIALTVAGIVFLLVAIAHAYRIFHHIPLIIGTTVVPLWATWLGLIVSLALGIWMLASICCNKCRCEKCERSCSRCSCKDKDNSIHREYPNE